MQIHGLAVDPRTSSGSNAGLNPDTTVAPGESITYTWRIPDRRNMEGSYVFSSMGADMRQQMAHGLFGVLNAEPKGSIYLSPITSQPLKSGWEAIIVDPNGKDFREDTIIYHEFGDEDFDIVDVNGDELPLNDPFNERAYRPGSRALNYRSEPFFRRQKLLVDNSSILGHLDNSQNYGSYMFGDPPTPRPRGYLGDPTKRRLVHAGSERFHVDHLHGGSIRWQFDPFATGPLELPGGLDFFGLPPTKSPPPQTRSQRLDSQALGPLESYTAQVEGGAGGLQNVPGDFLFHCHFGHHYSVGMWTFWRAFDTLQTGEPWQISPFPLRELPDRQGKIPRAVDSTRLIGMTMPSGRTLANGPTTATTLNIDEWIRTKIPPQGDPGPESDYDASVWNWVRVDDVGQLSEQQRALLTSLGFQPQLRQPLYLAEPETIRVWPNYRSPASGERLPIMFNPKNGRPAYPLLRPHLGRRPPFPPLRSGSPWSGDPSGGFSQEHPDSLIPPGARRLEYVKVTIPIPVTFNQKFGIVNSDATLPVLDEDKADIQAGIKPTENLTVRANVGDGIDVIHYTEIPRETFEFFKSNLHYHFVQFENQASDGVITGLSYEQSVQPYTVDNIHLTAGASAGSIAVTVDAAAKLKVNAFIGIGFGVSRRNRDGGNLPGTLNRNGGFEWAQIKAIDGNTLTLDRPLLNDHFAGQFVSTEFVRQQLFADAESGTTYFHNHVFAVPGFGLSLTGALIQEPSDARWLDPRDHAPIRSGSVADIMTSIQVAPGITVQNFREFVMFQMESITGIGTRAGGEPGGFNMRQEPIDQRGGEPAHVFSSVTHGDPETPVRRTYVGDLGVIRLLEASGHDMGAFHMAGHRFRVTRFDPEEPAKDTVAVGISERFDLFFTSGSVGLQAGDYIYMNAMHEKMQDAWGILRVFDTLQPDLQTIQDRFPLRPPGPTTFPQNTANIGTPPPSATEPETVTQLKTKLESNGYSLMGGTPVEQIPVHAFNVVALELPIQFSASIANSNGRAYVLAEDEAAVLSGVKPLEPLVLRANIGEIVRVNFINKLPGARASFHIPQLIQSRDSQGSAFGLNDDSTTAPGQTRTQWYALDPRFEVPRSFLISDLGDPFAGTANGLYGLFIVQPADSTYHDPTTGAIVNSGADVEVRSLQGTFRDVALIFHDDDPIINRDVMPYNVDVNGLRGINYKAEPFAERAAKPFPANVLDSRIHGDPATPLIEVTAGDDVRLHVAAGFGQQPHLFSIEGHRFPFETSRPEAMNLYARMFVPMATIDARLEGGAGGPLRLPGDYLYRDGRNPFFEGGLWGILRVGESLLVPTFSISGRVAFGRSGLEGVTMTLSGAATGTTTTDGNGDYIFAVANGAYTVTPSKAGFVFTPASRTVTVNGNDVTGQNFTVTLTGGGFSISGNVTSGGSPLSGVTVTLRGAAGRTTSTDANGNYSFTNLANGTYTVTPSKAGFTFTPLIITVNINDASVTGQDFAGTPTGGGFSISGKVTTGGRLTPGNPISDVTMTLTGAANETSATDVVGNYSFTNLANGTYTVTPSKAGFIFTPLDRTMTVNNANVTGQDFVGAAQ